MDRNSSNQTVVIELPLASCVLLDFPEERQDCSVTNPNHCLRCPILGKFITGEGIDDFGSRGHTICWILGVAIILIGIFGTVANSLIVGVLNRQRPSTRRAFDSLLFALACVDLLCSVFGIFAAIIMIAYYANWRRDIGIWVYLYTKFTVLFGRSASVFLTVLIAAERYLVLAYPLRTKGWFTHTKTKILVTSVLAFATLMALPRYISVYIVANDFGRDIPSTSKYNYIIYPTIFEKFFYKTIKGAFNWVDFWLPLPLLLLLNSLVYYQIWKFLQGRRHLNMSQTQDIHVARMFLPVVIVLLLCNIEPILHYYYIFKGVNYREHDFGVLLSYTFNSAANFPIYYCKGSTFRAETKAVLTSWFPFIAKCFQERKNDTGEEGGTATGSSVSKCSDDALL